MARLWGVFRALCVIMSLFTFVYGQGTGKKGVQTEAGYVIPAKGTTGADGSRGKSTEGGDVIRGKGTEGASSKFPSPSMLIKQRSPVKRSRNVCKRPKKVGLCRARIPRFYFDSASGLCVAFFYGGCGSNGNNFNTKKECAKRCGCRLPAKTGRCRAAFPRYYYKRGKCVRFTYGGCNPNENNFMSKKSCLAVCG